MNKPSSFYANAMLVVLLVNLLLCFVLVGLYLLILIGAWQVLDALFWVFQGDKRRRFYLGFTAVYLGFLYWLGTARAAILLEQRSVGLLEPRQECAPHRPLPRLAPMTATRSRQ